MTNDYTISTDNAKLDLDNMADIGLFGVIIDQAIYVEKGFYNS